MIRRVSPIEWLNIVLYGEIGIDPNKLWGRKSLGRKVTRIVVVPWVHE